jgi:hypothetical protein
VAHLADGSLGGSDARELHSPQQVRLPLGRLHEARQLGDQGRAQRRLSRSCVGLPGLVANHGPAHMQTRRSTVRRPGKFA